MLDTITFQGNEYIIRIIDTEEYGTVQVATTNLADALLPEGIDHVSDEAEDIDNGIFFYVEEDEINLPEEELISLIEESI